MKTIYRILTVLFGSALLFCACSEDMEILQEHPKQADAKTFMSNYATVQAEINAIYFQMHRLEAFGRYLIVLPEALTDYAKGRGNFATSYETGLTSGATGFVRDTWAVMYRCVRFANDLMRQIDDVKLKTSEYKELTGEIRFLRALAYSELVKYWGGVPFFTEENMDDFNKPRTDANTIWQYIEDEANYAFNNLPATPVEPGRPGKFAAAILKGEAAMWLKHYNVAQEAFESVIKSGRYSLVELTTADDFEKVYGVNAASDNREEIFYIKYNYDVMNQFTWMYLCSPNPVRNTGALGIYTSTENPIVIGWDHADFRYQYDLYYQTQNGTLDGLTGAGKGMMCFKFRDPEAVGSGSANDNPLMRYADALLWAAEARAMALGAPDETAMKYVNMIRRRAYGYKQNTASAVDYALADYSTNALFLELILKERGYEQCFEGKRYADLKRLGKLPEYALKGGHIASVDDVKDAAYWWPIPTNEYNYNDALDPTTDQNPGY